MLLIEILIFLLIIVGFCILFGAKKIANKRFEKKNMENVDAETLYTAILRIKTIGAAILFICAVVLLILGSIK